MEENRLLQEDELAWKTGSRKWNCKTYWYRHTIPILLFCTFVTTSALLLVVTQDYFGLSKQFPPKIYSPAESLLSYTVVSQEDSIHVATRYMAHRNDGLPSLANDAVWADLYMDHMHTSITPHEASKLPNKTVKIPGQENKFLIQLEVFHQIHCLDVIRKALYVSDIERYREHFKDLIGPDGKKNYKGKDADHIVIVDVADHCLDWIRQALLCQAEVTPVSWSEDPVLRKPLPQLPMLKVCRNTEPIFEWTRERDVGMVNFGFGPI